MDAAEWRGELTSFRSSLSQRLAAAEAAKAAGLTPDDSVVEKASEDFRYARDLVSAEECERWLAQRNLTFADLTTSITCRLQAELIPPETEGKKPPLDPGLFYIEALLADAFTGWARALAWRIAQAVEDHALPPAATDRDTMWATLERTYAAACAKLAEPARRQRALAAQRLSLLQTEVAVAEFGAASAAQEACLCVREDGDNLTAVAATHGFTSRKIEAFLGDLPAEWQQGLLGVAPGGVLPPQLGPNGAFVLQLLKRREPSLHLDSVRERLDASLQRQHFRELETRHIRWLLNVEVEA